MLKVSAAQLESLRSSAVRQQRQSEVRWIIEQIGEASPTLRSKAGSKESDVVAKIEDVLAVMDRIKATEPEHRLNWCYIRLLTDVKFYDLDSFRYIVDHPLLHPDAKARHVTLSYFAIQRLARDGFQPWQR